MISLENKVVAVTGGNGLLGQEFIKSIEKNGGSAINLDINNPSTTLEENKIICDITSEESIHLALDQIIERYGKLDGLVNNAYPRTSDWGIKYESIPLDSWKKNVDLQLNSYHSCCQIAISKMEDKGGSIINVSSIYGIVGPDFSVYDGTEMTMPAAYSAIKGGLINYSKYLASYYGSRNIRVNCLSPGGVLDQQPKSFITKYSEKVPLGRLANPSDLGPSLVFLLSDGASYITGHNLVVDGGWTCI